MKYLECFSILYLCLNSFIILKVSTISPTIFILTLVYMYLHFISFCVITYDRNCVFNIIISTNYSKKPITRVECSFTLISEVY